MGWCCRETALTDECTCCCGGLQVQGREGFPVKYTSVADCACRIIREEGVASFWRGSMCSFMKVSCRCLPCCYPSRVFPVSS